MKKTIRNPLLCALVLLLFAAFQAQQPQIRVEVEAVNVLVSVTDQKGRFVTGLTQDRFRIYEDGVPQQISNFSSQADLPLTLALLMDTSSSVRLTLDFQKKAATDFLHTVMKPQDRALLVEFDTGVTLLRDFTNNPSTLAKEIRDLKAGGGTALLDALFAVCSQKMREDTGRKAMVLISDGDDRHSTRGLEETLEMAQRSGVIIYAIGTTRLSADRREKAEELLLKLSDETGGKVFFPYSTDQLAYAFELINEELRSHYNIAYVPTKKARDGKFREIEVKIQKGKGLNVHHRKGYYAPTA